MTETNFYHISKSGKISRFPSVVKTLAALKKGGFIWFDFCQPSKEELSVLSAPLGLHPLSIEDCTDENQIPKIDDYPGNTFMLFNAFRYREKTLSIYELDVFIGKNFLVTVGERDMDNIPLLQGCERILKLENANIKQGPAFLLHVLLDHIEDQKFTAVATLEEELDTMEEEILANPGQYEPANLLHLRRNLLALRKSLFFEREIFVKLCRRDCPYIPDKAIYFYRDIYDHLAKFLSLTESYREIVASLMEMYLSLLNNQMAKSANTTNTTVRRLTYITTIFMPLSLLAGIGGMSEWSMMTGPANWKISYPLFLLAMVVIGVANYFLLKGMEKRNRSRKKKKHESISTLSKKKIRVR